MRYLEGNTEPVIHSCSMKKLFYEKAPVLGSLFAGSSPATLLKRDSGTGTVRYIL